MLKKLSVCFLFVFFALICCSSLMADTAKKVTNAKVLGVDTFFYSGSSKGVMITLDQKVPDYDLRKQIRITPSIGYFTIDRYYHETQGKYRVYGKFVGGKDYEIKVVGGLTNEGNFNIAPFSKTITAAEATSEMKFPTDCSIVELHSKQAVPLKFTHVGNFKVEYQTYPAICSPFVADALSVDPLVDEKDYNSSTNKYVSKEDEDRVKNYTDKYDVIFKEFKDDVEALKKFTGSVPNLSDFLNSEISVKTQTFMGSENPDDEYYFSLPLDIRTNPENGGVVVAKVAEIDKANPTTAMRAFQVTDMAITYKFGKKEMLVWVTSLETGKPLADVAVMIRDLTNAKLYFPGRTDKDGLLRVNTDTDYKHLVITGKSTFEAGSSKLNIADLDAVTVATQKDSASIVLDRNRLYSAIQMAAPDMRKLDSIRAYAFTERGVYRPGETVYWKAAFREYNNDKVVVPNSDVKANVVIFNSRGDMVYEKQLPLSAFGTCADSFQTKSFMPRGSYRIEVAAIQASKNFGSLGKQDPKWDRLMQRKPAVENEKLKQNPGKTAEQTTTNTLYTCNFQVQDFEAPRHFVDMEMTSSTRKIRQIVGRDADQAFMDCKIVGKYYAGGVLRNCKVQWSAYLTEKDAANAKYPGFCFGNNDIKKELLEQGNSVLNNNGELVISLPMSKAVLSGLNQIEVTATVLDIDGKPATLVKSYAPVPAVRVGISKVPSTVNSGAECPVQVIAIDNSGNKINAGTVTLEVMRKKWMYTQKRAADGNGGLYYNWEEAWIKSYSYTAKINNSVADFMLAFPEGGDYLLRAYYVNGQTEAVCAQKVMIEYSFSSYQDVAKKDRSRSTNEIFLAPDKTNVATGKPVNIKYTLPRICDYALVTVETDEIVDAKVIKLNGAFGEFTETLTDKCKPNAFISFIAPSVRSGFPIYSIDSDTEYPRAYFGFTSLKVQSSVDSLKIAVAPETNDELKALPGQDYKVNFKITDEKGNPVSSEVAVGVVDESVLALTGYVTPVLTSLSNFFMPLSIFSGDLRVGLINQELFKLLSTRILTGGGEGIGNISSDLNARKDFRPVAFWKADCVSDASGNLTVDFKLPDTMTSYRIYAVANDKGSSYGSAERQLRVTKDFYIEPSVPQFMTAGDKAVVVTAAHNKTDKAGTANVAVAGSEGISAEVQNGSVSVGGFNTAVSKVVLNADKGALTGKIVMKGDMNGNTDAVENSIPVNPASILFNKYGFGFFKGKDSVKADIPAYVASMNQIDKAGTLKAHLTLAATPWTRLVPAVSYLMDYPHGCVEQTSSRIIGLAAIRNIAKEGYFKEFSVAEVDAYLKDGLEHLLRMQLTSGGFSYWTSEPNVSWWGTNYAVYALTMLKESGYEYDTVYLAGALDYVKNQMFNNSNAETFKSPVMGLGVVALAMNKKINAADLQTLRKKFTAGDKEAESMLNYAECFVGEKSADSIKFKLLSLKPMAMEKGGWGKSNVRRDAFVLLTNAQIGGSSKISDNFAGNLFKNLTDKGYWTSTADTGIALNALAAYFKTQKPVEDKNFTVKVTTKNGTKEVTVGKAPESIELTADELNGEIKLDAATNAVVNYNFAYTYPDMVGRNEPVDKGFMLQKTIENMNGSKEIRVGDIVKVTFIFEKTNNKGSYEYLVLEDPIPAGFTAINTSLKNDALPADVSAEDEEAYCGYYDGCWDFYASHKELRKDAMVAYKDYCWSGRYKLVYYLRATCEGSFVMKPSKASLMYDNDVYGLSKASKVEILPAK